MIEPHVIARGPLAPDGVLMGNVLAVFPSSVYVAPFWGPLLVIHDWAHGPTPTSWLVDGLSTARWHATPGQTVISRLGRLMVGEALLDARHAVTWDPPSPTPRSAAVRPAALLDALAERSPAWPGGDLDRRCEALTTALAAADRDHAAAAATALVGLGPGLTPAGDDALVGVLAVLHRLVPPGLAAAPLALLAAVVTPLLQRTTAISAHYLALALDGHFSQRLLDVVDTLQPDGSPDPAYLGLALATGATSGRDALTGVAGGLALTETLAWGARLKEVR